MRHSTPSPHPYPTPTNQLPVVYGHTPPSMHIYSGIRPTRRFDQDSAASRSPLLDEFRTNKARKWELRVGANLSLSPVL